VYNRLNEHYREAHALAWLILDGLGIEDFYTVARNRTFAFLLDMNSCSKTSLRGGLPPPEGYALPRDPQRRDRSILLNADYNRAYTGVIPES